MGLCSICQRKDTAEFVANNEITALRLFVPAFHCSKCSRLMTSGLKNLACGMENMAKFDTPGCEERLMDQATIKIVRGLDWDVAQHHCELFQIRSRISGSQDGINMVIDHTYYTKDGKCFTISKPNTIPDVTYATYNEIASFQFPRRATSPDREFVGPGKVIVLEQHNYAKRGALEQGGRGPKRRPDRSRSRDLSDRNTPHANQRGSASASSGTNVGRHHQEDTLQGCSQCHVRKMS